MQLPRQLSYVDLGVLDYQRALELQQRLVERLCRAPDEGGYLLCVEHPPVLTLGRRAKQQHILASPQQLEQMGIAVCSIARGGDVTYHGPGQLVCYPILRLAEQGHDLHRYQRNLEEVIIRCLARFGIESRRYNALTGVWVGADSRPEKIAAIGVGVRRWVTYHGLALNVSTNMEHFGLIVPCGIADHGVTSMAKVLGQAPAMAAVRQAMVEAFADVFEINTMHELSAADVRLY